ncbi:winged helix-turn-helix transcriptional regulator [Thermomonospora umbrina]|nr:helix-turn-helix domain-containing protein [Thermomonospora umbrina]
MALGKDYTGQDCSLARALEIVGERWTLLIVRDAFYGVRRFTDFQAHLDVPRAVLAARLQTLVEAGVLVKQGHDYVLTEMGRELWPGLHAFARWAERHVRAGVPTRLYLHAACGGRLDPDGTCPECGGVVPPQDVETRPSADRVPLRDDPVTRALGRPRRLLEPLEPSESPEP